MRGESACPRCGSAVRPPGVFSNAWRCDTHGEVHPVAAPTLPTAEQLRRLAEHSRVPVWLPWPLPTGWLVTGLTHAGDDRSEARAVAIACTGPNPIGGTGDLVLVAEEPGVGLGARYAGITGPDPGPDMAATPAHAKIETSGHPTPLWAVAVGEGRAAYAGAAGGVWLWMIVWPETTDLLMIGRVTLLDARDAGMTLDLPMGALSPRL